MAMSGFPSVLTQQVRYAARLESLLSVRPLTGPRHMDVFLSPNLSDMFRPLFVFIGTRYTRAKRRNHFVSFISLTSMLGLTLGVMVMILVLSVMNGFDHEMRTRVLGMIPHATVESPTPVSDWPALARQVERHVEGFIVGVPLGKDLPGRAMPFVFEGFLGGTQNLREFRIRSSGHHEFEEGHEHRMTNMLPIGLEVGAQPIAPAVARPSLRGPSKCLETLRVQVIDGGPDDIHLRGKMVEHRSSR